MVNKRRGNKQGANGAVTYMDVVFSRLNDVADEVTLEPYPGFVHWQVRHKGKVLLDIWPMTNRFRVHDAPQGSPAVTGSADDVLTVVEWLLSKSSF